MKLPSSDDRIWIGIAGALPFAIVAILMFIACAYYAYFGEWAIAVTVLLNALVASVAPLGVYLVSKLDI